VSAPSAPSITSVVPNPVPASNSAQTLTINGSNFQNGATLTYVDTNGKSYPGRGTNFVNSGQLVDPAFNDASDAGNWTVTVVNPGGQSSNTFTFTVSAGAPTITSLSPPSYPSSGSNQTMTINGTNYVSGDTLTFVDPQGGVIQSTASKLTFVSSTQLSYQFNDGSDVGNWTVTVNSTDGTQHSNAWSFTVQ
jgi:hypothetical protein